MRAAAANIVLLAAALTVSAVTGNKEEEKNVRFGVDEANAAALIDEYVARHSVPTEALAAAVRSAPCSRQFISADFWGRGLANSVNVALNALALAIATNRTLLVGDDKKFKAGFWKYLGFVRWPRKGPVLAAFAAARGCASCGCDAAEAVRSFFPMNAECLRADACGEGVRWLLCDANALGRGDAPFVHVRAAVTWLAPLARVRATPPEVAARLDVLFGTSGVNTWGLLYDALLSPQPRRTEVRRALASRRRRSQDTQVLSPILDAELPPGRIFDLGVHVRHRRYQPLELLEDNAAACVAAALKRVERLRAPGIAVFLATEQPERLPLLIAKIERATGRSDLRFSYVNASAVDYGERQRLKAIARTDVQAVRAGRDWGPLGPERWLSAVDFYLLANARVLVGALSSTFSELAAAVVHRRTTTFLYDPIFQFVGDARTQHNWPSNDEYLRDQSPDFRCLRADSSWPLAQYVRLRIRGLVVIGHVVCGLVCAPCAHDGGLGRRRRRLARVAASTSPDATSLPDDLNLLMTEMNAAVAREDYAMAAACKKRIDALQPLGSRGDWAANGAPAWLSKRLNDLGMRYPTTIQARALSATRQAEEAPVDLVIRAPTGSGKSLAFLAPIAASLTSELEARERATALAVQNASLLTPAAAMEALSPALRTSARTAASRLASLAPPRGPPFALIVAPSKALAMQLATAVFSLVGGNARQTYFPGDKASLFSYVGPKGVRVAALASDADAHRAVKAAVLRDAKHKELFEESDENVDDDDPVYDDLMDCDFLIADAGTLAEAIGDLAKMGPHRLFDASRLEFVVVDEADACGDITAGALRSLETPSTAQRILVGATLSRQSPALRALLEKGRAVSIVEPSGQVWLDDEDYLVDDASAAPARDVLSDRRAISLPPSLEHRFVVVEDWRRLGVLARIMRRDLLDWESDKSLPRPRCVVFCVDEPAAREAAPKLRRALWGEHAVAALLPSLGGSPIDTAQSFARTDLSEANADFTQAAAKAGATVLVTAARAARGLSFPNVTHCFILGAPVSTDEEPVTSVAYAHQAGRAGRIGQLARGIVTTLGDETDLATLQAIFDADFPDVKLDQVPIPPQPPVRVRRPAEEDGEEQFADPLSPETTAQQRAYLEDLVYLYEDTTAADTTPLRPRPIEQLEPPADEEEEVVEVEVVVEEVDDDEDSSSSSSSS
ncbi:hypothetical protein CTAYLR_005440 [Chrysophaeum taylorii]|uniref:RNA helicase n=1 Tax=Chrysophaeum taylorii TaxID=2483200 RepID=A0AAD7XPX9_9STRA|nr:hypothetical protein CTAYLR_005440 [Chrysophaeum taylorii]